MNFFLVSYFFLVLTLVSQPLVNLEFSEMSYPLNTAKDDFNPIISPSSKYLLFQSNRVGGKGNFDIWLVENENYKNIEEEPVWRNPINFAPLNTDMFEGGISIRFNENDLPEEIFFTSVKNTNRSGYEGLNLYYTKRNKSTGNWSEPIHLSEVNSDFDDKMPAISPDGQTLIFSSNRPGGFGKSDLWISYKNTKTNTWSEPSNLGKDINSSKDEISPYYHYDGKSIFFSSNIDNLNSKYSIYKSDYLENNFSKPKRLQFPFNSQNENDDDICFSITKDGVWVYFASNRNGFTQGYNIFRAKLPENLRYSYDYTLKGLILDGASEKLIGLETTVTIYEDELPKKIFTSKKIDNQPFETEEITNFETQLSTGKFYRVEIKAPGYYPNRFVLDLRGNIGENKSKYIRVILMPIEEEEKTEVEIEKPEIKEEKKRWFIKVIDKTSKKMIENVEVTLFSENNRDGTVVFQDAITSLFALKELPKEDFQIFVKSDGYVQETKKVSLENMDSLFENSVIEVELDIIQDDDIYGSVIYFKFNTAVLDEESKTVLNKIVSHLKRNKDHNIEIGGHTDNIGSKKYNVPLSEKRAEIVKDYLVENGIESNRITIVSYWFSQPVVDNSTEENRARNRRVAFKKR